MPAESRVFFSTYLRDTLGNANQAGPPGLYGIRSDDFTLEILQFVVSYKFTGTGNAAEYGPQAELDNGIIIQVFEADGTLKNDLTDGIPLVSNADWIRAFADGFEYHDAGNHQVFAYKWQAIGGNGLVLSPSETAAMIIQYDLSGLDWQYGVGQGLFY